MLHSRTDKQDTSCTQYCTVMYNNSNQSNNPSSESYAEFYDVVCVLNAVFSLTALTENFLLLGAIWSTSTLHKPTNILLLELSLSDLAVGLIVQPMFIVRVIWKVNEEYRQVFRFISAFLVSATILTLTSVSVERCLALILHLRYVAVVTVKKTIFVLCLIWLASVVYVITFLIDEELHCSVSFFVIALSIVVTSSMCSMIYRICRRLRIQIQSQSLADQPEAFEMKRYRKSLITMMVLLILLISCYTLYICIRAVANFTDWPSSPFRTLMLRLSTTFVYLNSSINPVIYGWRVPAISGAMKQFNLEIIVSSLVDFRSLVLVSAFNVFQLELDSTRAGLFFDCVKLFALCLFH